MRLRSPARRSPAPRRRHTDPSTNRLNKSTKELRGGRCQRRERQSSLALLLNRGGRLSSTQDASIFSSLCYSYCSTSPSGPGYTCGRAIVGKPTRFYSSDGRRATQALMTWNVTCTYSQFLAQKTPTCCVSLSSFYNDTIVNCPTCSCGCQNNVTHPGSCVNDNSPYLQSAINGPGKITGQPLVQCTSHMCPIRVHWHVKLNYKDYWRVKVTITNFNYRMNYSDWNLVAQHPNFNNITKLFSFNYKPLTPYGGRINDTAMFWGMKFYNDFLNQAGPLGNAQSEVLMQKDSETFTLDKGWAFPRRVYFNGDNCVMPSPDSYPWLPNASPLTKQPLMLPVLVFSIVLATLLAYV